MPTEHQGPIVGESKEMHYDYMCRDKSGAVFIVEMQQQRKAQRLMTLLILDLSGSPSHPASGIQPKLAEM
jgi:hypothetical protein